MDSFFSLPTTPPCKTGDETQFIHGGPVYNMLG